SPAIQGVGSSTDAPPRRANDFLTPACYPGRGMEWTTANRRRRPVPAKRGCGLAPGPEGFAAIAGAHAASGARRPPPAGRRADRLGAQDSGLVRAAKDGSEAALGELFRRYQDRIYTIACAHLQSREDALDATQEVFIRVAGNLAAFREESWF